MALLFLYLIIWKPYSIKLTLSPIARFVPKILPISPIKKKRFIVCQNTHHKSLYKIIGCYRAFKRWWFCPKLVWVLSICKTVSMSWGRWRWKEVVVGSKKTMKYKKKSTYKVVESSYLGEKAISLYIFGIGVRRGTPVTLSGILCEITWFFVMTKYCKLIAMLRKDFRSMRKLIKSREIGTILSFMVN